MSLLKKIKCTKCSKRSIYILEYCDPVIGLCKDHAPKLSNGEPGYKKLTVIEQPPLEFGTQYYYPSNSAPIDRCYNCNKLIVNRDDFIHQSIKNMLSQPPLFMHQAVPIVEIEYWICKKGCDEDELIKEN